MRASPTESRCGMENILESIISNGIPRINNIQFGRKKIRNTMGKTMKRGTGDKPPPLMLCCTYHTVNHPKTVDAKPITVSVPVLVVKATLDRLMMGIASLPPPSLLPCPPQQGRTVWKSSVNLPARL